MLRLSLKSNALTLLTEVVTLYCPSTEKKCKAEQNKIRDTKKHGLYKQPVNCYTQTVCKSSNRKIISQFTHTKKSELLSVQSTNYPISRLIGCTLS